MVLSWGGCYYTTGMVQFKILKFELKFKKKTGMILAFINVNTMGSHDGRTH